MTRFYCCSKLEDSRCVGRPYNILLDDEGKHYEQRLDYFEVESEHDEERIDFCPFCGYRLSSLS
jgi:hypothetical protein